MMKIQGYAYNTPIKTSIVDQDRGNEGFSEVAMVKWDLEQVEEQLKKALQKGRHQAENLATIQFLFDRRRGLKSRLGNIS